MISDTLKEIQALLPAEPGMSLETQKQIAALIETLDPRELEWELLYQCITTIWAARRFPDSGFGTVDEAKKTLKTTLALLLRSREAVDVRNNYE